MMRALRECQPSWDVRVRLPILVMLYALRSSYNSHVLSGLVSFIYIYMNSETCFLFKKKSSRVSLQKSFLSKPKVASIWGKRKSITSFASLFKEDSTCNNWVLKKLVGILSGKETCRVLNNKHVVIMNRTHNLLALYQGHVPDLQLHQPMMVDTLVKSHMKSTKKTVA